MHFTSGGSIIGVHGCGNSGMIPGIPGMPGLVGQPALQSFRESVFEEQVSGYPVAGQRLGALHGIRPTLNGGVPVGGTWGQHSGRVYGSGSVMGWR